MVFYFPMNSKYKDMRFETPPLLIFLDIPFNGNLVRPKILFSTSEFGTLKHNWALDKNGISLGNIIMCQSFPKIPGTPELSNLLKLGSTKEANCWTGPQKPYKAC